MKRDTVWIQLGRAESYRRYLFSIAYLASRLAILLVVVAPPCAAAAPMMTPAAASPGASVIVAGSGMDDPSLSLSFAAVGGGRVTAPIVLRSATVLEAVVPAGAVTGDAELTDGVAAVASFAFTVKSDSPFARVVTLISGLKTVPAIAILPDGAVYIADPGGHRILHWTAAGGVSVLAGSGAPGHVDGSAIVARFHSPEGLAYDAVRNVLYVADTQNHSIRRIAADGTVTTLAGSGKPGDADGSASKASFHQPSALTLGPDGDLYVADTLSHKIRRITLEGAVSTVAGKGRPSDEDGAALLAGFHEPRGIALGSDGALYVADTRNNSIRRVHGRVVTTIAGTRQPGFADGPGAIAQFHHPQGVTVSEDGSIFVADTANHRIRRIDLDDTESRVVTIAGTGVLGLLDGPPDRAMFRQPSALMWAGALYVADSGNGALRLIEPELRVTDAFPRRGRLTGEIIRIFGSGFVAGRVAVSAGDKQATITAVTPTQIIAELPAASAAGVVDIIVSSEASSARLASAYVYLDPPTLAVVQPGAGPTAGGDVLAVRGSNFVEDETIVRIGANELLNAAVSDAMPVNATTSLGTRVDGTTPPGTHGPTDITVSTPGGSATLPGGYIYFAPPVIQAFTPSTGFHGTAVTITGENFDPDAERNSVRFGSISAAVVAGTVTELTVIVPDGAVTAPIVVTSRGGATQSTAPFTVPFLTSIDVGPSSVTLRPGEERQLVATALYSDGSARDVTGTATWSSDAPSIVTVSASGVLTAVEAGTARIHAVFGAVAGALSLVVEGAELPPDPATIAPAVNLAVSTSLAESTAFLYTGPNPIQRNVLPATIQPRRAAVVRGNVTTREGQPLAGVRVFIPASPALGWTLSRADGAFDLAVNGGGLLTVTFTKDGYLPAQRNVTPGWNRFDVIEPVALVPLDPVVTRVETGSAEMQIARGSTVTDEDGERAATILFRSGTGAAMVFPDGTSQPLDAMHVRATEYTVGPNGPAAMPAPLPQHAAYTYCVELSVDEAIAAGATRVQFSRPVVLYVDNFLDFPVGTPVPVGYYDRQKRVWIAAPNGLVVKVLSVAGGLAALDLTGDGIAEGEVALAARAITAEERAQLAGMYTDGQTLWRSEIDHFTPVDHNWPLIIPGATPPPDGTGPETSVADPQPDDVCQVGGSVIECQSQVLGESIGIAGTPFSLEYRSSHVPGRRAARALDIILTGSTPPQASRISMSVSVAGREEKRTFAPDADLRTSFEWDGRDAYGRPVQGAQPVDVTITYTFPARYAAPSDVFNSMPAGVALSPARTELNWSRTYTAFLRPWDAKPLGLGGWMIDAHQAFDVSGNVLYRGDGSKWSGPEVTGVVRTFAGTGICSPSCSGDPFGQGIAATQARIANPRGLVVAADGSTYVALAGGVARIDSAGKYWRLAGNGTPTGGDGGPALQAGLNDPWGIALAPDGTIYVSEPSMSRIRRIDPQGIITTFAGTGVAGYSGDGGPAVAARFRSPRELTLAPDGSLYVADLGNGVIRRIGTDGRVTTVAGTGGVNNGSQVTDGVLATATNVIPMSIAAGADGTLYMVQFDGRVRAIAADGIIRTVAAPLCTYQQNEFCALSPSLTVTPDGTLYVGAVLNNQLSIRRIEPAGRITVMAGGPAGRTTTSQQFFAGDGGLSTVATWSHPEAIAVTPDGALVVADTDNWRIRRVNAAGGIRRGNELLMPGGGGVAVFDEYGRHIRTVDSLTGATLLSFSYDSSGQLAAVEDGYANRTVIDRTNSAETAILAPGGQRTTLRLDGNGYLAAVSYPAGETVALTYTDDGLLQSMKEPGGAEYTFSYTPEGRLRMDADPAGGNKTLDTTRSGENVSASVTTALGATTVYSDEKLPGGDRRRVTVRADGASTTTLTGRSGITTATAPDGSVRTMAAAADPRFGMLAPFTKSWSLMNGAKTLTVTTSRARTPASGTDPLSFTSLTETLTVGGRTYTSTYESAPRRLTTTSPAGRKTIATLNALGETVAVEIPGMTPVSATYDASGRVDSITHGTQAVTFRYDERHRLLSMKDALGKEVTYGYDDSDRVVTQTLPDGRVIGFSYDANGNVTSVTPPSRPVHGFTFNPVHLPESYEIGDTATRYVHNVDRQLESVELPGGRIVDLGYDAAGRLNAITSASGSIGYTFDGAGRLKTASGDEGTLTYAYDGALLQSVTSAGVVAGTIGFGYDSSLRPASETVAGNTITFGYDADSLLTSAGAITFTRHPQHGLLTSTRLGNVRDAWTYTASGKPSTYSATHNDTSLLAFNYTRDATGRITAINDTGYEYDDAGRLKRVTVAGAAIAEYDYDANGNRIVHRWLGGSTSATFDERDRLLTYGDIVYSYTANGNLHTKTLAGATTKYDHDTFGNLRRVELPGDTKIEYVVDAQNRRVGKKVNGTLVQGWLYADQLRIVAELDGAGTMVSRFVYGSRTNVPDYMIKDGVAYRILSDHLGSPRLIINTDTGAIVQRMEYDAFGVVTTDTAPGFQPFGFAGGLYEHSLGLLRFGARDYDPQTGRFISTDPIGFAGGDTNLYAYVLSDPVNLVDPMGTDWVDAMEPMADFFAGMGDTLSFGLTTQFNDWTGASAVVDKCSGAFGLGELAGTGVSVAFGASHLGRNALYQAGRGGIGQGLRRLAHDNRTWGAVRSTWSRAAGGGRPFLREAGQSLHHVFVPQRAGLPNGISNAGLNYIPLSAGFNSWMNGSTFVRSAAEWGVRGTVAGIYGGLAGGLSNDCGC